MGQKCGAAGDQVSALLSWAFRKPPEIRDTDVQTKPPAGHWGPTPACLFPWEPVSPDPHSSSAGLSAG